MMDSDGKPCSPASRTASTNTSAPALARTSADAGAGLDKLIIELTEQQRCELELLYLLHPSPSSALLQSFMKDRPSLGHLDKGFLRAWFAHRRLKEETNRNISSLIHKHAELKAEQQSLLLRNSQLRSQALLLNLENLQLKKQLEMQLERKKPSTAGDLSAPSSITLEDISSYSANEEEVQCDLEWSSDDSCSS